MKSQELDPNYNPTQEEVEEYAKWLGMQLPEDEDLLYIAREGAFRLRFNCNWLVAGSCSPRYRTQSSTTPELETL